MKPSHRFSWACGPGRITASAAVAVLFLQIPVRAGLVNSPPSSVKVFRVYELALDATAPGSNPYTNGPTVTATFTGTSGAASGKTLTMKGFWDGGNIWRIRFAPTAEGNWSWATSSSDAGLNAISGTVTAVAATAEELAGNALYHGFLQRSGYAWTLSDGTAFLPAGDTLWSFSEETTTAEWQQWMSARQTQKFNSFLGNIWLAIYARAGVPIAFPNGDPQNDTPNMTYFQRLDAMVQYANDRGIMMGLCIGGFPQNSNWWNRFATLARNDRWFKYSIARYTAYNVRWCLYGEVNETNPPWNGWTWQQQVSHDAQLVKDEDPYDHPLGSHHNSVDTSSANNANIDYIEVQIARTETQYQNGLTYRQYNKPIWYEEYWYEPPVYDNDVVLGIRNTHRNFVASLVYPTMGSLMRAHYPDYNINDVSTDPGALRMGYFADFYKGLAMASFSPASSLVNRGQCGRFGSDYAIFLQAGGDVVLDLTNVTGSFNVTKLDINSGTSAALSVIQGGAPRTISPATSTDTAILVTFTGTGGIPGDFNGDSDVDQSDFGHLQICSTGFGQAVTDPACLDADLDGDQQVDLDDVAVFLKCKSGAGVPATPGCANN